MVAEMRYSGHIVRTRRAAAYYVAAVSVGLLMFAAIKAPATPLQAVRFGVFALMPALVSYRCLRFLKQLEQRHDAETPTPEMSFIFGLAVVLPIALSVLVLAAITR